MAQSAKLHGEATWQPVPQMATGQVTAWPGILTHNGQLPFMKGLCTPDLEVMDNKNNQNLIDAQYIQGPMVGNLQKL